MGLMLVKDILIPKLTTIDSNSTMQEASKLMLQNNFRHLPVTNGKEIIGILSDRDVKLASVMGFEDSKKSYILTHKHVTEFMSSPVLKARPSDRIELLIRDMISFKVSCFVIENDVGEDIGIITTEDLLISFLDVLDSRTSTFKKLKKLWSSS
jgi:acetoin utilization protein AcuB